CDFNQTKNATMAIANWSGPVYFRFGRPAVPNFTDPDEEFIIGKAQILQEGHDVTIICNGHLTWKALEAHDLLLSQGIDAEVLNIHTIKPLDEKAVLQSVRKTRCIVTAEEHQMAGGLGESIASLVANSDPVPMEMIAVKDSFGESGTPDQLLEKYGLTCGAIVQAVEKVLNRKVNQPSIA
ncbi:MAG TPA: transketolase C-terminal domain-containing protein, partial [Bacteroidia bacterium]|nr:transketolase C-terminal domain-containing protein [Bacteroidia bacterium]